MLFLIYLLLAMLSASIGWVFSVGTGVLLVWALYYAFAVVWNKLIEYCSPHFDVCWQVPFLSFPAPLTQWLLTILPWGLGLMLLFVLIQLARPAGNCLKAFSRPYRAERLPRKHPLQQALDSLANQMGIRPPRVFIIHQPQLNAFAVSSLGGSAMGLSAPLMRALTPDQLLWVSAHEYSHIRHHDSLARSFWIASLRLSHFGFRLQSMIERWVIEGVFRLLPGFLWLFVVPLTLPLALLNGVLLMGYRISLRAFLLLARRVDRAIEFRSDKEAGLATNNPLVGIEVLQAIDSNWEFPSRLMHSTHPPAWDRIARLSKHSLASVPL